MTTATDYRRHATRLDRLGAMLDRTATKHYERRDARTPGAFARAAKCDTEISACTLQARAARREAYRLELLDAMAADTRTIGDRFALITR